MSLNFDAYHKWLGIPPEEQPPHYYRLLGLKPFETDADVIDSAADQRLAHLRSFTTGARAQFAQQILNEVAAARVCLLDPQTRAEYDSELRTRLRAEEIAGTAAVQAIPVAQPLSELDPLEDPLGPRSQPLTAPLLPHVPPPKVSARSNSGTLWPLFAGIAAVVLLTLGGAIAAIVFSGVFDPQVAVNPSDPPAAPHVAPVEPIGERPSSEPGEELPENRPSDPAPEPPIEEPPAADPPADPAGPSEEQPTEPTAGESEPEPPLPQPGRLAIPSAEQQQGAKAKLEEVFDLNGPRNTAQKKLLVRELRNLGLETSLERPIERWVLLRQSIDLGVELADARIVLDTVGELARDYEFDAHSVKQAFLLRMAGAAADADSLWEVVEQGKAFADAAAAAENFETALAVYEALYRACQKPFGRDYRKLVFDNRAEIVRRKEAWERLQQHIAVLANNPEDPVANLAVGRWELFERNDFAAALPFLAKSNGPALREAALAEMNGAPDSDAEMAIADAWFDASQAAEGDSEKETLNHRAGRWYQRAEASVTSQLTRVKIQKRLAEIGPIPATAPSLASSGGSNTGSQSIAGILSRNCLLLLTFAPDTIREEGAETILLDLSPARHRVMLNGASPLIAGRAGQALELDGTDDYLLIEGLRDRLAAEGKGVTVASWMRTTRDGETTMLFDVGIYADKSITLTHYSVFFMHRQTDKSMGYPPGFNDGGWKHVAFVWDGKQQILYFDGAVQEARETHVNDLQYALGTAEARIGGQSKSLNRAGRYFKGAIDEFVVFSRALAADEVALLHQHGMAGRALWSASEGAISEAPPSAIENPAPTADAVRSILARDCVLCYTFEPETFRRTSSGVQLLDSSPSADHGKVVEGEAVSEGVAGAAYSFDGKNDCIIVPKLQAALGEDSTSFSLVTWMRRRCDNGQILNLGKLKANGIACGTSWFALPEAQGGVSLGWSTTLVDRQWNHLAYVWNGEEQQFYRNGTLNTATKTGIRTLTADSIRGPVAHIARRADYESQFQEFYAGDLDEFAVFTRALSAEEVKTIYDHGAAGGVLAP